MNSIQSGLETCHSKLALESSLFVFCFQQLNTASCIKSLKPTAEFHLSEACWETEGRGYCFGIKLRLFGDCSSTFIRANGKAQSNIRETGVLYNIPENLNCSRSTNPPGREEESLHREKLNIFRKMMSENSRGQLFPKEQGAKCSDADSRTGTHPERGKQGRIRDCRQLQSRAPVFRDTHDDEADPRSRWKSIHWSESGLMTAVRDKHSSVSTRQVHRDGTYPQSSREVHMQVWVQVNRDHGQAKTQLSSRPALLQRSSGKNRRPG